MMLFKMYLFSNMAILGPSMLVFWGYTQSIAPLKSNLLLGLKLGCLKKYLISWNFGGIHMGPCGWWKLWNTLLKWMIFLGVALILETPIYSNVANFLGIPQPLNERSWLVIYPNTPKVCSYLLTFYVLYDMNECNRQQTWVFPKIMVHFNRVFHYKPSILVETPYPWKHPYGPMPFCHCSFQYLELPASKLCLYTSFPVRFCGFVHQPPPKQKRT